MVRIPPFLGTYERVGENTAKFFDSIMIKVVAWKYNGLSVDWQSNDPDWYW